MKFAPFFRGGGGEGGDMIYPISIIISSCFSSKHMLRNEKMSVYRQEGNKEMLTSVYFWRGFNRESLVL